MMTEEDQDKYDAALNRIWQTIGGVGLLWDSPSHVADKTEQIFNMLGRVCEDESKRRQEAEGALARWRIFHNG